MADLENMLLEAAGRKNSPVRKRNKVRNSRTKHEGASFSDGGSDDSKEEDSDKVTCNASKRPTTCASNVPLKKRLELEVSKRGNNNNNENGNKGKGSDQLKDEREDDDSSEEFDLGNDLYKNEGDKQRLAKMTELEREMILSDRATKKSDKEIKDKFRMKRENAIGKPKASSNSNHSSPLPSSTKIRSSARHAEKTAAKGDVLSELRAKRMKQQTLDNNNGKSEIGSSSSSSKGAMKKKQKMTETKLEIISPSSSSQSESTVRSESERESSDDDGELVDSDDDKNMDELDKPTFEDIKEITIRRSRLVKWLNEPFFEELMVGCFVRIGIGKSEKGPIYRLCMVQRVDCGDPKKHYKVENRVTHKYLICVWGSENSAAKFQVAVASDSSPLEKEFKQWLREVERTCSHMPSKQNVLEKKEAIRRTNTYVYSAATVKQMLEEKKSAPSRPLNVAVEKDRLKNEMEIAKSKNDEAWIDRINAKLEDLEASRRARETDVKAIRLTEMNRKNRVENFKSLSEYRQMNANLKEGEEGYDPFSRRWTRSRNYYNENQGKEIKGEKDENDKGKEKIVGVEETKESLEAAANAGKLIDTIAPVDCGTESNMLHDFELSISLVELKSFGGKQELRRNVFFDRKQKIEATVGYQVPENDGRKHALTLTISDYKRRRGLL
ncbi:protein RTF1 homolog [Cicer arietinum]|uniref:Protein RTF1 homolog n=1 Tax=Cicer arietinum TaxID=3827 RepID=A0A3Q7YBS2_CICAR|nr:protein RTF1 homolog [Cicer arietinum]